MGNIRFARPTPFKELTEVKSVTSVGTTVSLVRQSVVKKIPLSTEYRLSALLEAGVPLDKVSIDITSDADALQGVENMISDSETSKTE